MKTVQHLCSQESHLSDWKWPRCAAELQRSSTNWICACMARKWHLVQAVACRIYGSLWEGLLKWSYFMSFPCNPSFLFSDLFFFRPNVKSYIRISFNWINELNKETTVWLTNSNFLWTTKLGIWDGQAIKLMANMTERNGLVLLLLVSCQPSLNACIFSFLFFLQFEFVLLCFCYVLFCFVFLYFSKLIPIQFCFILVVEI